MIKTTTTATPITTASTRRIMVLATLPTVMRAFPHFGHFVALELMSLPHSEHLVSAIRRPPFVCEADGRRPI
jgi:hypothetical protein